MARRFMVWGLGGVAVLLAVMLVCAFVTTVRVGAESVGEETEFSQKPVVRTDSLGTSFRATEVEVGGVRYHVFIVYGTSSVAMQVIRAVQ